MNIPCPTCERKSECTRDRRCNRPCGIEHAMKEVKDATVALEAAANRVHHALAGLATALVIHKAQE